jgi:hypothetical protein
MDRQFLGRNSLASSVASTSFGTFFAGFIQDHLQYHASFLTGVLRWCPDADHPLAPSVYSVDPQIELRGGNPLGNPLTLDDVG